MDWFFFILLNAAYFIRPADLVQSADLPLYNILMIACLVVSGGHMWAVIANAPRSPITMCVLGVVLACVLSHLTRAVLGRAAEDGFYILKIITYYLVMVAVVVTPARMVSLLHWLVCFTVVVTGLASLITTDLSRSSRWRRASSATSTRQPVRSMSFPGLLAPGCSTIPMTCR